MHAGYEFPQLRGNLAAKIESLLELAAYVNQGPRYETVNVFTTSGGLRSVHTVQCTCAPEGRMC
jgi:hypothetical protein